MKITRTMGLKACILLMMTCFLIGCGSTAKQNDASTTGTSQATTDSSLEAKPMYSDITELSGKGIAVQNGSVFDVLLKDIVPGLQFNYFNNRADVTAALKNKKVEGCLQDEPIARLMVARNPEFAIIPKKVLSDGYGIALQKNSELTPQFNAAIAQLKADGTLDEMKAKWTGADESIKVIPDLPCDGANGTLKVAFDPSMEPMDYIGENGQVKGFDLELVTRIAQILDRKLELIQVDFQGILPMIQSGKADVGISSMSVTDERKEVADMTDVYYDGGIYCVVRNANFVAGAASGNEQVGFIDGLKASFNRTFIVDNRWVMILDGLKVTVLISVFACILGSILGFALCMIRRSNQKILSMVAAAFIRLIQGTPIVVLLMILYYVIFGKVDISAMLVAVIGFAINFGVYVSEMIRTGLDAVDGGQIEAAYALGYTKGETFRKITFPQAARHFLPVFKGEFISMVKMTSIVGYIAIQDLTKVSDIIRSRTMEAFFPLIATAVIYFLVANIMTMLLSRVEISLDPKRRKRTVKGVVMK